eukprot:27580-Rhodomonas_salina.1
MHVTACPLAGLDIRYEDNGRRYEDNGRRCAGSGHRYEDNGHRYEDNGHRYEDTTLASLIPYTTPVPAQLWRYA